MNIKVYLVAALCSLAISAFSQGSNESNPDSIKRYIKVPAGYLMVLRQGDDLFKMLEAFAIAEKVPSAMFSGFGFVNANFGFFNNKTKEYKPKYFPNVEMGSMMGSIAWQESKPSLHIHGIAAGRSFKAVGGHLLGAVVSTGSLEILITLHDKNLLRLKEEPLGANVLQLGH